ncbi:MAG: hypothetical protein COX51_05750 [Syntrophobacteraceae bacterium CG23_combo_of_CG06-09_8_20_14_all_50_8]|nr:MAG: hypothetical protein COX51_05750 [Syntrophobacteraceae bacterium CG23_combo_of_CG06-09_8_20_14_all_50_8]
MHVGTIFGSAVKGTKFVSAYHHFPDFTKGKKIGVLQGKKTTRSEQLFQDIGAKMANSTIKTPL